MELENIKESMGSFWDNLAEGWRHLWQSASGSLTRFKPGDTTDLPVPDSVDDLSWLPSHGWSILGGDLFEDGDRLVVRLEVPGLTRR